MPRAELMAQIKVAVFKYPPYRTGFRCENSSPLTLTAQRSEPVAPTDHLVVVGASAIAATIEAFAAGAALDWSEQVVVVASSPVARQLATAGTALLNAARPATIVTATEPAPAPKRGARLVASPDAERADRARAEALVAG